MLSEGKTRLQIQQFLKDEYGISQSTINSDFLKALSELKKQQEPFISEIKSVIADRYEILGTKAVDKGDLKTAAAILKQESDLFGLNEQIVVNGDFEVVFN